MNHYLISFLLLYTVSVNFGEGKGTGSAVVLGSDLTAECKYQQGNVFFFEQVCQ